ncbi:MAG: ABC transporter ATP-binding protein [Clostridiales bacterium]
MNHNDNQPITTSTDSDTVLELVNLRKEFMVKTGSFQNQPLVAANDVSFAIKRSEGLALVGESGCGKSTVAKCILQLERPTSGDVILNGRSMMQFDKKELRKARSKIQLVFQDPADSLNPRYSVRKMLMEVLTLHTDMTNTEKTAKCYDLLRTVGINENAIDKYPHEFSGGQQQRIGIARALATGAEIFVLDEPTSALDTSIQGQILDLLINLQKEHNFTYLFITHNLSVIQYLCKYTAVMYLGRIVEIGKTEDILNKPIHPYTRALMNAIPIPDPTKKRERAEVLAGEAPSPINVPKGCFLCGRCKHVTEECHTCNMALNDYGDDHKSSCLKSREFQEAIEKNNNG